VSLVLLLRVLGVYDLMAIRRDGYHHGRKRLEEGGWKRKEGRGGRKLVHCCCH